MYPWGVRGGEGREAKRGERGGKRRGRGGEGREAKGGGGRSWH